MTPRAALLLHSMEGDNPVGSLRDTVIHRLTVAGMSREGVLGDLEDLRGALAAEGRDDEEEFVMKVMDQLVGWCSPQWSLAKVGTSEYAEDAEVLVA